jgi:hypothetical protein
MARSKKSKVDAKKRASLGGAARRDALTPEQRREVAKNAADERWAKNKAMPRETHSGVLKLGEGIPCAVLSNNMRVLSAGGLERAFGSGAKRGPVASEDEGMLPAFLSAANMRPFITPELMRLLSETIVYKAKKGGRLAHGFEATILNKICNAILDARAAGKLRQSQQPLAAGAELLMRGFAEVGLVALIDEATGYQAERASDELHRILSAYISKELLPWVRRFPPEFFEQIYRIHGWRYEPGNTQRPQYVGHFINRYVYEQLPDGVLDELRRRNPPVDGRRKHKHSQLLTKHTGNPHLDRQVVAVTTVLRLAESKPDFVAKFERVFPPRHGTQTEIEFPSESDSPTVVGSTELTDVVASPRTTMLAILDSGNTVPTKELALAAYSDAKEATLGKARKLLNRLRDEGLVESLSPGLWRKASLPG